MDLSPLTDPQPRDVLHCSCSIPADARNSPTPGWLPLRIIGHPLLAVPGEDGSKPMLVAVPVCICSASSGFGGLEYSALEAGRSGCTWMPLVHLESTDLNSVSGCSLDDSSVHLWDETNLAPVDFQTSFTEAGAGLNEQGTSAGSQSSSSEEMLSLRFLPEETASTHQTHTDSPILE